MLLFPFLVGPAIFAGKLFAIKAGALAGFRLAENGLDWPATLEDLKRDHRVLTAIGLDTVKLVPAIARLQKADNLEDIIRSAHAIKRAVDHLPDKTRDGLNRSVGLADIINSALRYGLQNCGLAILKQRAMDEDISAGLARYYFGLFLLGRGGGQLTDRKQTEVILILSSLHGMRQSKEDLAIKAILQTWQPNKAFSLGEALLALREAFTLLELAQPPMFKVYITRALGGDVVPTSEVDLLTDLIERFPENPKAAA